MTSTTPAEPRQRYELVERIGAGGMAEVFRSKAYGPHGFEKALAIKRILPEFAATASFERRFIAEARIAATLTHANIVPIFDFGRFGESLYIAMELVDGTDLSALLALLHKHNRTIPVGAALYIAMELLKGLDYAHSRGVVHCDVSPSNILLSRAGEVKLADFGIAHAIGLSPNRSQVKQIVGKWRYMSPEQTQGDPLDPRSDVFSAAAVLFELFTGRRLFDGENPEQVVRAIRDGEIPSLQSEREGLPADLNELLQRALARPVADREGSASVLLRGIVEISYASSVHASALELSDLLRDWLPAAIPTPAPSQESAKLIDDILQSELALREAGRRTQITSGANAQRLSAERLATPAGAPHPTTITLALPNLRASADTAPVTSSPADHNHSSTPTTDAAVDQAKNSNDTKSSSSTRPTGSSRRRLVRAVLLASSAVVAAGLAIWFTAGANNAPTRLSLPSSPATATDAEQLAPLPGPATEPKADSTDAATYRGVLQLLSEPAGARVAINGQLWHERTPAQIPVDQLGAGGPLAIELTLDGYEPCQLTATLPQQDATPLRCELRPLDAEVTVRTTPPGATVWLDQQRLGHAPLVNVQLPSDHRRHQLRLQLDGHAELTEKVRLRPGDKVTIVRQLQPVPQFGTIDLFVEPWADIYLKGDKIGVAPQRKLRLPVGRHRLQLVNPVQQRSTWLDVTVPAKQPYRVALPAANTP